MTGQPIDPSDIRVGDTVRPMIMPITITAYDLPTDCFDGTVRAGYPVTWSKNTPQIDHWELISPPRPKPEIGQHWLSPDDREWVVLVRGFDRKWFYGLDALAAAVPADVAPDGWTLKGSDEAAPESPATKPDREPFRGRLRMDLDIGKAFQQLAQDFQDWVNREAS